MALFAPLIVGLPIGYFTWSKVFQSVDNTVFDITHPNVQEHRPISVMGSIGGTVTSMMILSKLTFRPATRQRLFFGKLPPNANIRIETLKMGIELLFRAGVVFYGGAIGGAITGRMIAK
ncbi:hypothetical protein BDB01DRAFT_808044 [Pilobolus umbonatus]|nr:hypothetical protein BDB01DRAFT_808044 [Pilobolus umbonatus]